jgi:hypothetical protein
MIDFQALMDGMSHQHQRARAETQMTLGKFIVALQDMPPDTSICGLGGLDSYRGYYADLAFSPNRSPRRADELLTACRAAMGRVFEGYKGGEYVMGALTPLWIAQHGSGGGERIMAIRRDGNIETAPEDDL